MKNNKYISLVSNILKNKLFILSLTTIIFILAVALNFSNVFSYSAILLLLGYAILLINDFELLSSNGLFLAFFIYAVGIGPIFFYLTNIFEYNYFIIIGALLAFGWGNLLLKNLEVPSLKQKKKKFEFKIEQKYVLRILFIISTLASIVYLILNKKYLLSGSISSGRVLAMSGNGVLLQVSQLSVLVVPMMYDLFCYKRKDGKRAISKVEIIVLIIIASLTLLFSGFRAPLITLYVCLILMYVEKNKISNKKILLFGLFIFILLQGLSCLRAIASGGSITFFSAIRMSFVSNCRNLQYIFETFPSKVSFQHGYTYLINLIMLKPGPDLDFTLWLKEKLQLDFSGGGVTPTIIGEFYINFGYYAIYVGMFILGIIGNFVTSFFRKNIKKFLGAFYVLEFAHCVSGGIANIMIPVILYTILYLVINLFPSEVGEKNEK